MQRKREQIATEENAEDGSLSLREDDVSERDRAARRGWANPQRCDRSSESRISKRWVNTTPGTKTTPCGLVRTAWSPGPRRWRKSDSGACSKRKKRLPDRLMIHHRPNSNRTDPADCEIPDVLGIEAHHVDFVASTKDERTRFCGLKLLSPYLHHRTTVFHCGPI